MNNVKLLKTGDLIVGLFILSSVTSFLYVAITGVYNGDFYGVPTTHSNLKLFWILLASLLPYLFAFAIYRYFVVIKIRPLVVINNNIILYFYFFVIIWSLFVTFKYGVGVMTQEAYSAPSYIKPLIQIGNRLQPFYVGIIFILTYTGNRKIYILGIFLLVILGVARAGLGVFLYIGLAILATRTSSIMQVVSLNKFKALIVLLIFPLAVTFLYDLRKEMRGPNDLNIEMTILDNITARLIGRLSAFSDLGLILQENAIFEQDTKNLSDSYFLQQVIGGVIGIDYLPSVTPENLLINVYGGNYTSAAFMAGVPGNLYMSLMISPYYFALNIILIILMVLLIFYFCKLIGISRNAELGLIIAIYPLTSGVANEFSFSIVSILFILIFFIIIKFFKKIIIKNGTLLRRPSNCL